MSKLEKDILQLLTQNDKKRLTAEAKLLKQLLKIYDDCRKDLYIQFIEAQGKQNTLRLEQLEALLKDIEKNMKSYTNLATKARQKAIDGSFLMGQQLGSDILAAGGVKVSLIESAGQINRGMVEALFGNIPQLSGKVQTDVLFRIRDELTRGAIMGESIPKIAKRIFGTGLTQDGMKKPFDSIKTRCEVIARTETIKASDAGYEDLAAKAEDILGEELYDAWITAHDERVDAECRSIENGTDNRFKSIAEHPGVYERRKGPRPVISTHPRCRCRRIPYLLSWEENGQINLNKLRESGRDNQKQTKKTVKPVKQKQQVDNPVPEINRLLSNAPINDRQQLVKHLLDESGLSHIPAGLEPMSQWGYCSLRVENGRFHVNELRLKQNDARPYHYQIKTAFHELTHARADGSPTRARTIHEHMTPDLREAEETVAETVAHFMLKEAGIQEEICPSYSNLLVNNLPKLKQLQEFRDCAKITDFGKILSKYRYIDRDSELITLRSQLASQQIDLVGYSSQYKDYIFNNIDSIAAKIAENNPSTSVDIIKRAINGSWNNMDVNGPGFTDSLIVAMNRLGVK